jgi:hypothetical protein
MRTIRFEWQDPELNFWEEEIKVPLYATSQDIELAIYRYLVRELYLNCEDIAGETDQVSTRKINISNVDCRILTGTELIKVAVDDWNAFPDNDETLFEWYPDLAKVLPNKKYKVNPQLEFEEVDE